MAVSFKCHACGEALSFPDFPSRRDECPKCGADVHACRNCRHYDRLAYNECREPQAEVVREKDRANFCDHYSPGAGTGIARDPKLDLLAAAEALFKKK